MRLFKTIAGLRSYLASCRQGADGAATTQAGRSLGLVPTMGALHEGHLSLIRRARQENAVVAVSIFVNPLQFGPQEDFHKYPKMLEQDSQFCETAGVDVIFAPSAEELYGGRSGSRKDILTQVIPPQAMMAVLCGPHRPGHFEGVATVVAKLLNIVQPDRAYFGQKDAQQLAILRRVVADLNLHVELVACPTVREASGLALSSRNQYLSPEERSHAAALYRSLHRAEQAFHQGIRKSQELISIVKEELSTVAAVRPQYVELVHPETMVPLAEVEERGLVAIAAHLGSTRLIDNIVLSARKPIIAIDGPAGAGKSTVARRVAAELGLLYLDTGAMYRAVTWLVQQSGVEISDEAAIAELVSQSEIELVQGDVDAGGTAPHALMPSRLHSSTPAPLTVLINGQDVTREIRTPQVSAQVSAIAAQGEVRRALVKQQKEYGRRGGVVMDGRDIGTQVFPDAELKIFLTASVQERARRRQLDLKEQGQPEVSLETLERAIFERDQKDSSRKISPLRKADDAIELVTDDLTIEAVVEKIICLYRDRLSSGL
ncbi:bifunctional pantoate--beta-alanine ligase/(d)CMP kinase [Thermoleptolyngbya sichuanensis A183]|uniref:Bifunctional pantoate ligase/cytidylate kinase n=1 Tax=Thermoleptolyngbya sichuanensis A183 TaxID=2737172 RepID=A0A6M8BF27_9CYAN|nr:MULTISPECIES: bifunctional pantoate--beta-alanine ligase/(d)CMP kinase [Thermoleptolyngbya]MDG2616859.1 bifunctional pantoate--beta-alanine ligase/(d)CMP kinase [Thermoleptolyngbya sichuanensis XZ-Cy5]QKD83487.1 bifunctional pantoate--beta-alanine ligase/(d)CMP kinase [Thermoleptolyngbya sichuanensis A183]